MTRCFHFESSTDWALIKRIMTHPRVWPHISDDSSPAPNDFAPVESESLCYVVVEDHETALGLFILEQRGGVHVEVHTCLLPTAWIRGSRDIGRQAIAWLWENCPQIERITTAVPQNNSVALRFARALGMVEYGVNPLSFKKGGVLMDQTLLGMSRPKETA